MVSCGFEYTPRYPDDLPNVSITGSEVILAEHEEQLLQLMLSEVWLWVPNFHIIFSYYMQLVVCVYSGVSDYSLSNAHLVSHNHVLLM